MQDKKKKNNKPQKVSKPFLRGKMIDRTLPGGALKFFGFLLLMAFVFFMSMLISTIDIRILSIAVNVAILCTAWLIIWQSGMNSGADAVNQGEIMLARREKGRPVADWEESLCYHPLKGLIIALVGSIPLIVCSVAYAFMAERQMHIIGVLPSWVSGFESRPEIGGALQYYHPDTAFSIDVVLRIIARVTTMPIVSMVGADNWDAVLVVDRLSPVLNLIPAIVYGVGYAMGTEQRAAVHTNVALGKQNLRRKQIKERRARQRQQQTRRGPEELN